MPFLAPVKRHRVKHHLRPICYIKHNPYLAALSEQENAEIQKRTSRYRSKLTRNKRRKLVAKSREKKTHRESPLHILSDNFKRKETAVKVQRVYIPRINDCNGVLSVSDYKKLKQDEKFGNSGYQWDYRKSNSRKHQ